MCFCFTAGIGLGIAHRLAQSGSNVVFNGFKDTEKGQQLVTEFQHKYNIQAMYSGADMSQTTEIVQMVNETVSKFGGVDILVNNGKVNSISQNKQLYVV